MDAADQAELLRLQTALDNCRAAIAQQITENATNVAFTSGGRTRTVTRLPMAMLYREESRIQTQINRIIARQNDQDYDFGRRIQVAGIGSRS